MKYGSAELCSICVDFNFGITSIRTQCIFFKDSVTVKYATVSGDSVYN